MPSLDEWRQSSSKRRARTSRLKVRAARAPDGTLDSMDRKRHSGTGSRVTETMVCCAAAWQQCCLPLDEKVIDGVIE